MYEFIPYLLTLIRNIYIYINDFPYIYLYIHKCDIYIKEKVFGIFCDFQEYV